MRNTLLEDRKTLVWLALVALAPLGGCGDDGGGGGGGGGGVDGGTSDSGVDGGGGGGGDEPELVDQVGCHMLGDGTFAVPPYMGATRACIVVLGPQTCFLRNESQGSCLVDDRVWFEWEPGGFYNVKMFDWNAETSTHGEVTTQTNADSGIIGIPPSTTVTATATRDADGRLWTIVFRMEDDYVVFEKVEPPGGW